MVVISPLSIPMAGFQHPFVDAIHHGGIGIGGGRGNQYLAGASLQVSGGLLPAGETAGAFQHQVHVVLPPGQLGGRAAGVHGKGVAVNPQGMLVMADGSTEAAVDTVMP